MQGGCDCVWFALDLVIGLDIGVANCEIVPLFSFIALSTKYLCALNSRV